MADKRLYVASVCFLDKSVFILDFTCKLLNIKILFERFLLYLINPKTVVLTDKLWLNFFMNINGEIIVVEDDQDDREFLADIFESLKITNKIVFFEDPTKVIPYLLKVEVKPFLVLSDINMPKMDGYELRNMILKDEQLNKKCIPYIFLSTSKDPENIHRAFALSAHGYFRKEENFKIYQDVIGNIITYWKMSQTPKLY